MTSKPTQTRISRRKFMFGTAAGCAMFQIVPGHVLGLNGATSPNEKLNIAGVGIGGQGGHDINQMKSENIVALCDVDSAHAAGLFKQFPNAKIYRDFREMLDKEKGIDGVVVGTPDHLHAFVSVAAMERSEERRVGKECRDYGTPTR